MGGDDGTECWWLLLPRFGVYGTSAVPAPFFPFFPFFFLPSSAQIITDHLFLLHDVGLPGTADKVPDTYDPAHLRRVGAAPSAA